MAGTAPAHRAGALLPAPLPTPERVAAWVCHRPIGPGANRREEDAASLPPSCGGC
jgi:hypothetical protein